MVQDPDPDPDPAVSIAENIPDIVFIPLSQSTLYVSSKDKINQKIIIILTCGYPILIT